MIRTALQTTLKSRKIIQGATVANITALQSSHMASTTPKAVAHPQFNDSHVLLATTFASRDTWADYLRASGLKVQVYPDQITDLSQVEFAICWNPEPGLLAKCTQLKAIQSMGAGVDSLIRDDTLPRHVPLLRVIDPLMSERMATWVLWAVINIQRKCDAYYQAQQVSRWDKSIENFRNIDNSELRVGLMGAGVMGGAVADVLTKLGYQVSSWTRRARQHDTIKCYHGMDQLKDFASQADVVVCLLPLTDSTRGILNKQLFDWMPQGASVINAARGGHLVVDDLIAALDSGKLASAVLDVFEPEPLPVESPLWKHPCVRVFPHVSSMTNIETGVEQMLANRECVLRGKLPAKELVVDWNAGY